PRNLFDNAVPSGSSMAIETLLRLKVLTGEARYEAKALAGLRAMADLMSRHPTGLGRFLCAHDLNLGPVVEIAVVAPHLDADDALRRGVFGRYRPNGVVAGAGDGAHSAVLGVPLLEGRRAVDGRTTVFVCRNYACQLPATDSATLGRQLSGA